MCAERNSETEKREAIAKRWRYAGAHETTKLSENGKRKQLRFDMRLDVRACVWEWNHRRYVFANAIISWTRLLSSWFVRIKREIFLAILCGIFGKLRAALVRRRRHRPESMNLINSYVWWWCPNTPDAKSIGLKYSFVFNWLSFTNWIKFQVRIDKF